MSVSYHGGQLDPALRTPRAPRLTTSQRRRLQALLDDADRELEVIRRCDADLRRVQEDRLVELRALGQLEERRTRTRSLNPADRDTAEPSEIEGALAAHRQRLDRIGAHELDVRGRREAASQRWQASSAIAHRVLEAAGFRDDRGGASARDIFEREVY